MTTLNETLTLIAAQIKCDANELIAYSDEDTELGGFHILESERKFPMGSAWEVELRTLYALVRYLKPDTVIECGGWRGASASHLALAVKANGVGHVYSVDNGSEGGIHGELIPLELQQHVTLVKDGARVFLAAQPPQSIGLLFEDASHDTTLVAKITRLALSRCEPGGLYVNHDAMHDFAYDGNMAQHHSAVGAAVREGLARGGAYATGYRAEPSDCGLAITVIPGVRVQSGGKGVEYVTDDKHEYKNPPSVVRDLTSDDLATLPQSNFERGYMGNANIEGDSEPPPIVTRMPDGRLVVENTDMRDVISHSYEVKSQTTEEDTKETPVKKPRGKGKRKPSA